ncbi:MAG: helix-turn-helix domain-containing protein [Clostridiales bacterium]|jgi:putative transcriptional regulator|nr:helix-turn-helix domain-containing protein [Clostridiales bacterium]
MPMKFKVKVQLAINNMTQKQLAEVTGIRPPTVSAICTGAVKQIPVSALERICDKLNCQPGDLMEYVPDTQDYNKEGE